MERDCFVQSQIEYCPKSDEKVLYFIADFLFHEGLENAETIRHQFHAGYCYYFAHMLKQAFGRGKVCVAAPYGHFVWKDEDGICYDVEGVTTSEAEYFIPESFMGDVVKDFLHIRGVAHNTTKEEIDGLIERYKATLPLKVKSIKCLEVRQFYDSRWKIDFENGESYIIVRDDTETEENLREAVEQCKSIDEIEKKVDMRDHIYYD